MGRDLYFFRFLNLELLDDMHHRYIFRIFITNWKIGSYTTDLDDILVIHKKGASGETSLKLMTNHKLLFRYLHSNDAEVSSSRSTIRERRFLLRIREISKLERVNGIRSGTPFTIPEERYIRAKKYREVSSRINRPRRAGTMRLSSVCPLAIAQ